MLSQLFVKYFVKVGRFPCALSLCAEIAFAWDIFRRHFAVAITLNATSYLIESIHPFLLSTFEL